MDRWKPSYSLIRPKTIFPHSHGYLLKHRTSATSGKNQRRICDASKPRLLVALFPYLLVVFTLTTLVFLGDSYDHRIESRNLKMIARSWDPTKPRWYQLIRVASGYEIQSDGFQNLTYTDCTSFEVHRWREVNVTDYRWPQKYQKYGTAFQRDVFALVRTNQDVATILCPPSTFLSTRAPVDFQ